MGIWKRRFRCGVAATLAGVLWWFTSVSPSRIEVSAHDHCLVSFPRACRHIRDCTLAFYRDGALIGKTVLGGGLFTHPRAVFPGPDGQSVVCCSWLDTTFTAFSVDLRTTSNSRASATLIPQTLEEAVESSDLPVRACTTDEVAYVSRLITEADPARWVFCARGVMPIKEERAECLRFLQLATTPNLWRDPALHGAPPKILPIHPALIQPASRL